MHPKPRLKAFADLAPQHFPFALLDGLFKRKVGAGSRNFFVRYA